MYGYFVRVVNSFKENDFFHHNVLGPHTQSAGGTRREGLNNARQESNMVWVSWMPMDPSLFYGRFYHFSGGSCSDG